ncbi:MAG: hypothetical protein M3Q03_17755 [Chloroflexota bacterium]|nr:hypothetical protein [Chloroflexota bacterium]
MCHNPMTAYTAREIHRQELLAEAAAARRVKECRRSPEREEVVAAGMRRLGAILISVGTRLQGTTSTGTAQAMLATLDPSP